MVKRPSEGHPVFTVLLDGVAIDHEKVKGAVACVQDFVCHPSFTQRNFFSETGIGMLNIAVTAADAVRNSARFDACGAIDVEAGPVIIDLKSCRGKILSQRKAIKNTQRSGSLVPRPLPHQLSVRVRLKRLSAFPMLLRWGTCSMWLSMRSLGSLVAVGQIPGKVRRDSRPQVLVSRKNNFLFLVHLLVVLHSILLFRKVLRSRGRGEVVAIAAMPQYSKGDINNNLTV